MHIPCVASSSAPRAHLLTPLRWIGSIGGVDPRGLSRSSRAASPAPCTGRRSACPETAPGVQRRAGATHSEKPRDEAPPVYEFDLGLVETWKRRNVVRRRLDSESRSDPE